MARKEKQIVLQDNKTGKTVTVSEKYAKVMLRNPRYQVPVSVENIDEGKENVVEEVVGDISEAMEAQEFDKAMEEPKVEEPKKAPRKRAPRKK